MDQTTSSSSSSTAVHQLIDELSELRGLFHDLSRGKPTVEFQQVLELCKGQNQQVSEQVLGSIWSGINHGQGLEPIDFEQFLQFLSYGEAIEDHEENSKHVVSIIHQEGSDANASTANVVAAQLSRSCGEKATPSDQSVRALLTSHIRTRPDFETLKSHGIYYSTTEASSTKLQKEMAKDLLKRQIQRRPSIEELEHKGIVLPTTPKQTALQRQLLENHLKHALESSTRPDLKDLQNRGIIPNCTAQKGGEFAFSSAALLDVERNLNKVRLKHGLENPNRPNVEELQAQGIFVNQTPQAHQVEKQFIKTQLNRRLSSKPDLKELAEKGILESES